MSGNQIAKNLTCAQRGNGKGSENQVGGNPTRSERGDGQGRKDWKGDMQPNCRNLTRAWKGDDRGRG